MTPHDPSHVPANVRKAAGRFARLRGREPVGPFARRVAQLRQAVFQAISRESVGDVVHALVERAKNGDVAAAQLVLEYTLGEPLDAVDPDEVDRE